MNRKKAGSALTQPAVIQVYLSPKGINQKAVEMLFFLT